MCEIAVIADMMVGHEAAIWPLKFNLKKGSEILASSHQKVLLQYWRDFWNNARNCEYVINLAESIEGKNKKEHGRNLMTPDIDLQCDAAESLLRPYIREKQYFSVKGSDYHDSEDTNVEERIAKNLGGTYCEDILNLRIKKTGHVIWGTHSPGNAMLYRITQLDRFSLYMSAIKSKLEADPDIVLFGHQHKHFGIETDSRIVRIVPCWKFWHPIKSAARYPFSQPSIGGLILRLPKNKKQIQVDKYIYPLIHVYDALREV
jgi:hypothetical protein